jgi:hypothetical protein
MRAGLAALAGIAVALAACGPVSVEQAERECLERARGTVHPRGTVALGGSTTGAVARVDLDVSSDFLAGRDPSAVYEGCVIRKTGLAPRQPLYMIPDWKG